MLGIIVVSLFVGAVLGWALGRRGVRLGLLFLLVGLGPMAALYVYETYFYTKGDTSSLGMLSTLALLCFGPFGLVLVIFGALRGE